MEKIISLLNRTPGIAAWKIGTVENQTQELYFVGKNLETNRSTDTVSKKVTIYIDQDGKRGASTFSLYDYMTEEELKKKLQDCMYAASFAMNPYYDLPAPVSSGNPEENSKGGTREAAAAEEPASAGAPAAAEEPASAGKPAAAEDTAPSGVVSQVETPSDPAQQFEDGGQVLDELSNAVFAADVVEHGSLNATEFFLHVIHERIINSNGVDVSTVSYRGDIELIPSWEENGEEAEVYQMLHFRSSNPADITRQVGEELQMAGDRFRAVPLKDVLSGEAAEGLKVLVQDQETAQIFSYFSGDLNYRTCYEKSNLFELGETVQGEQVTGTPLNMKMVPYYPEALDSRPFDQDGTLLKETELVRGGIAVGRFGSSRFGQYLGVKDPAGNLPVMVVEEGTKSYEEMKQEPYLRCVKFSGLQLDRPSGYFGGEVRLGYYFDGEKEIPVTGFSISGSMKEAAGSMNYSSDTVTLRSYHGPRYLEIHGMTLN